MGYWQNVYLCALFFKILVKGGLLVNFLFFCDGGVILRLILPYKSECQPICQNSIQIKKKKIVSFPRLSKTYSPSVLFKDGLKLYVFESLKWKYKFNLKNKI